MAVNSPFFTKREPQTFSTRPGTSVGGLTSPSTAAGSESSASVRTVENNASAASMAASSTSTEHGGSKLTVGPNIKLKGVEITDCDTLVVEGTVEATMDSRVIQIAQQGAFHGSAEIDIAEIHGEFEGSLTVRQKLVIHSTGKVSGKIRYGKIVIEEGGQLSGEIEVGIGARSSKPAASSSPAVAVAAA
ncbi:polymer-forming cytoskeletal protein [Comamonas sp.]|uniref:bactofilin family protein n=1 Tax=Comamonas sp. TaxID=34028 RepID=UPI0028A0BF2C|nr:polymer-forming cytoskeletal protein [Comamonas sp.]